MLFVIRKAKDVESVSNALLLMLKRGDRRSGFVVSVDPKGNAKQFGLLHFLIERCALHTGHSHAYMEDYFRLKFYPTAVITIDGKQEVVRKTAELLNARQLSLIIDQIQAWMAEHDINIPDRRTP